MLHLVEELLFALGQELLDRELMFRVMGVQALQLLYELVRDTSVGISELYS